jgi:hypothetical protein
MKGTMTSCQERTKDGKDICIRSRNEKERDMHVNTSERNRKNMSVLT